MYSKYRSWGMVTICIFAVAGVFFVPVLLTNEFDLSILLPLSIGLAFCAFGLFVARLNRGEGYQYKNVKVDKSLSYTFTLVDIHGNREIVTDYDRVDKALDELYHAKTGEVIFEIEPPMGTFRSVESCYKKGLFYTYYLQERDNGTGYWYSMMEDSVLMSKSIIKGFFKRKKIDFYGLNYMETGEAK